MFGLFLLVGFLSYPELCQARDAKQEFLASFEAARPALRKHLALRRRIQILTTSSVGTGQVSHKSKLEFLSNSRCLLVSELSAVQKGKEFSFAKSKPVWYLCRPDGVFTVYPSKKTDAHVLTEMTKPPPNWEDLGGPLHFILFPLVEALSGLSIVNYVSREGMEVVALEECVWEGAKLTRVKVRDPLHRPNQVWVRCFYFDRARKWLLHGMEHYKEDTPTRRYVTRWQYRGEEDGLPIPHKYEAHLLDKGKSSPRQSFEFVEFARADPADSEFELARFGLPEPADLSGSKPSRWYLWLFASAGVVGIFAVLAWRRARRTS